MNNTIIAVIGSAISGQFKLIRDVQMGLLSENKAHVIAHAECTPKSIALLAKDESNFTVLLDEDGDGRRSTKILNSKVIKSAFAVRKIIRIEVLQ